VQYFNAVANVTVCLALATPITKFVSKMFEIIRKSTNLLKGASWYRFENGCDQSLWSAGLPKGFFMLTISMWRSDEGQLKVTLETYLKLATVFPRSGVVGTTEFVNAFQGFAGNFKISHCNLENVNFL
jgi:hypothetical protein